AELQEEFQREFPGLELVNVVSSYRDVIKPTVDYVRQASQEAREKEETLTVLIPQFVPKKSWQNLLHNQMSLRLKYYLRWNEDIVIASYSFHLKD
ncbi:amino acid permease, partial [Streptococcus loxodontisalivarius]